jgi:hypothetical protein
MRLIEFLLEDGRDIHARKWTVEEIESAPALSGGTLETAAKVGSVIFDQVKGLGATPNNQNIVYRGFVAMMYPKDFASFAATADRSEDAQQIAKLIKEGYGVGSPFLILDVDRSATKPTKVVGHEGRARCVALNNLQPNVLIPVHCMLYGETRARHIDDQMISRLNSSITAERTDSIVKNKIQSVWVNGKHITL